MGLAGAQYLDETIMRMRAMKQLHLNECNLGDKGVAMIVARLEDFTALNVLDLSGNNIGQSSYYKDAAAALIAYLIKSTQLEDLKLDNNMLRGPLGYQIIDTITQHQTISSLSLSNNFLGQAAQCVEPPAALFTRMLIQSRLIEHLDLSYNQIDRMCCFSLAHGLRLSKSIVSMSLEANPIGNSGMR